MHEPVQLDRFHFAYGSGHASKTETNTDTLRHPSEQENLFLPPGSKQASNPSPSCAQPLKLRLLPLTCEPIIQ